MKQKIEIDVPYGKEAVRENGKVEFKDAPPTLPKTWDEYIKYYLNNEYSYLRVASILDIPNRIVGQHLALIKMRHLFYSHTQPENIRKGKHRPFRVIKKWFNRYQRKIIIGLQLTASINDNKVKFVVTDARLCKMAYQCVYRLKGEQSECLDIDVLSGKPISYTHENGEVEMPWEFI